MGETGEMCKSGMKVRRRRSLEIGRYGGCWGCWQSDAIRIDGKTWGCGDKDPAGNSIFREMGNGGAYSIQGENQ